MKIEVKNVILDSSKKTLAREINLSIDESSLILGPVSVGKSFLLSVIAGVTTPESGEVYVSGKRVLNVDDSEQLEFRKKTGVIFEKNTLISNLNLFANMKLFLMAGKPNLSDKESDEIILKKLEEAHLLKFKGCRVNDLSERQLKLASFIKATIHEPNLLLWDNMDISFFKYSHHFIEKELESLSRRGVIIGFANDDYIAQKMNLPVLHLEKEVA